MINKPFNVYGKLKELMADVKDLESRTGNTYIDKEVTILKQQINNLIAEGEITLPDNAELLDLRLGADGVNYTTAGEAVRTQFLKVQQAITQIDSTIESILTSETF